MDRLGEKGRLQVRKSKCPYCGKPDGFITEGLHVSSIDPYDFLDKLNEGWRRCSDYLWKQRSGICCRQHPIRVNVHSHDLSKDKKKVWKVVERHLRTGAAPAASRSADTAAKQPVAVDHEAAADYPFSTACSQGTDPKYAAAQATTARRTSTGGRHTPRPHHCAPAHGAGVAAPDQRQRHHYPHVQSIATPTADTTPTLQSTLPGEPSESKSRPLPGPSGLSLGGEACPECPEVQDPAAGTLSPPPPLPPLQPSSLPSECKSRPFLDPSGPSQGGDADASTGARCSETQADPATDTIPPVESSLPSEPSECKGRPFPGPSGLSSGGDAAGASTGARCPETQADPAADTIPPVESSLPSEPSECKGRPFLGPSGLSPGGDAAGASTGARCPETQADPAADTIPPVESSLPSEPSECKGRPFLGPSGLSPGEDAAGASVPDAPPPLELPETRCENGSALPEQSGGCRAGDAAEAPVCTEVPRYCPVGHAMTRAERGGAAARTCDLCMKPITGGFYACLPCRLATHTSDRCSWNKHPHCPMGHMMKYRRPPGMQADRASAAAAAPRGSNRRAAARQFPSPKRQQAAAASGGGGGAAKRRRCSSRRDSCCCCCCCSGELAVVGCPATTSAASGDGAPSSWQGTGSSGETSVQCPATTSTASGDSAPKQQRHCSSRRDSCCCCCCSGEMAVVGCPATTSTGSGDGAPKQQQHCTSCRSCSSGGETSVECPATTTTRSGDVAPKQRHCTSCSGSCAECPATTSTGSGDGAPKQQRHCTSCRGPCSGEKCPATTSAASGDDVALKLHRTASCSGEVPLTARVAGAGPVEGGRATRQQAPPPPTLREPTCDVCLSACDQDYFHCVSCNVHIHTSCRWSRSPPCHSCGVTMSFLREQLPSGYHHPTCDVCHKTDLHKEKRGYYHCGRCQLDSHRDGCRFKNLYAHIVGSIKEGTVWSYAGNARIDVRLVPPSITEEKFSLFQDYQREVHHEGAGSGKRTLSVLRFFDADPSDSPRAAFLKYLVHSPISRWTAENTCGTYHFEYRLNGRLFMVTVADILPDCINSVYCFYDPRDRGLMPGKFSILFEMEWMRKQHFHQNFSWYYLGMFLQTEKMSYKAEYRPCELLNLNTLLWVPVEPSDRCAASTPARRRHTAPQASCAPAPPHSWKSSRPALCGGAGAQLWKRAVEGAGQPLPLACLMVVGCLWVVEVAVALAGVEVGTQRVCVNALGCGLVLFVLGMAGFVTKHRRRKVKRV
ncbi:Arginyl-tRNA--protein transferase 2 [Diplonema papillatum]|nr:Arginyl-tRNA--protein transferase 2 [Diplonema papillatum]